MIQAMMRSQLFAAANPEGRERTGSHWVSNSKVKGGGYWRRNRGQSHRDRQAKQTGRKVEVSLPEQGEDARRKAVLLSRQDMKRHGVEITDHAMKNLPTLTGTDKQVEWATKIRKDKVNILVRDATTPGGLLRLGKGTKQELHDRPFERMAEQLKAQTSAKWWIDYSVKGRVPA